MIEEFNMD